MPINHTTSLQARRTLDYQTGGGGGYMPAGGSSLGGDFCHEIAECLSILPEWEKSKYTAKLSQQNSRN